MDTKTNNKGKNKLKFEIGQRFGTWTITNKHEKRYNGQIVWECKCDCGNESNVTSSSLNTGKSTGCFDCARKKTKKPICDRGHDTAEWGRTKSGACRGCVKEKSLFREYGITLDEYKKLWDYQGGKCAICGKDLSFIPKGAPGWQVQARTETDHEHVKDKTIPKKKTVRGLLCGGYWAGCNRRLGKVDDLEWLKQVIKYLEDPPARHIL